MEIYLNQSQDPLFDLTKTTMKVGLDRIFAHGGTSDHNELNLYMAHYNRIPNIIGESDIDCKRAMKWFSITFLSDIKESYFNRYKWGSKTKPEIDNMFFFLFEDLMVNFDNQSSYVRILFKKSDISKIEEIISKIRKFKQAKANPRISLLVASSSGIETMSLEIIRPKLNIQDNYNNDFMEIHQSILKRLSRKKDKGLILLHGKPGTGKTSYIRYLIGSVKKKVIFLPPNMAAAIAEPNLISILIQNPNSIFVIEDAENIIVDRDKDGSSQVSTLLNISDGLLSDCLNIQIICSFNTDISKVDSALLRKGRLIAKYEFKELEVGKAQLLSDKLGFSSEITCPQTLTAIYNQEEMEFKESVRLNPIGFRASMIN
jgi:hypothetical protein